MKHTTKLAVLLALSVVAFGSTAYAADYTETISGSGDTSYNSIKKDEGSGNYTYDFRENSRIAVQGGSSYVYGIGVENLQSDQTHSICINPSYTLDLLVNQNDNAAYGIFISDNTADGAYVDRRGGGNIEVHNTNGNAYGVTIENGGENKWVNIGDAEIIADARGGALNFGSVTATGLQAEGTANQIAMGNGKISTTAIYDGDILGTVVANGILAYDTSIVRTGNVEINVQAEGNEETVETLASGINASFGASSVITKTQDINVKSVNQQGGNTYANGIFSADNATVKKESGKISVEAQGNGTDVQARGLYSNSGNISIDKVDIEAIAKGGTNANAYGVYALNGGKINIANANIIANAYTNDGMQNEEADIKAILAIGSNTEVNINQGKELFADNKILGDIKSADGAVIALNLNTTNSYITGAIETENNGVVNLSVKNGAVWNNIGQSTVSKLAMHGGVVSQQSTQNMTIQDYSGTGDFRFQADGTAQDGVLSFTKNGTVTIGSAAAGSVANLSVSNTTVDTLDAAKAEESLNALAYRMIYTNAASEGHVTGTVRLAEGLITPEASGELHFYEDGADEGHGYVTNGTSGPQETATMSAMKHIAAVSVLAWRQEDSTFSQRLGDLRRSAGGQGLWARMSRGEFKYDGEYKNQYDFYQLGYDRASGPWHYGAAFSYNDGETSYRAGYGENSSAALSLYGTWLGDKGHYADIVLKGGKLSNEYTITTAAGRTHGDYDLWGVSLSGEYGREIALNDGWFVTPQAQMTLLHVGGDDYTTDNGIRVSQESLDSAVGRVGLEAGKRFGAGRVYGKFSLLHDFAGSADTWLRYEGRENSYREDIGDTWCEAGFGVNLRLTDSTYFYADVARTFGGDVETPWQWNAGVRWGF